MAQGLRFEIFVHCFLGPVTNCTFWWIPNYSRPFSHLQGFDGKSTYLDLDLKQESRKLTPFGNVVIRLSHFQLKLAELARSNDWLIRWLPGCFQVLCSNDWILG